jgi:toxin ParE1/3/4
MAQITWTSEAQQWLRDIFDYIAKDNPTAADSVVSGIYRRVQILLTFAQAGHLYREEPEGEIRVLLYGHYRIAYLLHKNANKIEILGIFHGAMEIDRYLE